MYSPISRLTIRTSTSTAHQSIFKSSLPSLLVHYRPASKKSSGGSANGRDSNAKHLGIKKGDGSYVKPCDILVRQRGTQFHPGLNVGVGKDWTLHALAHGRVVIHYDIVRRRKIISVDDGSNSLNPVTTRTQNQAKQMLADSIDMQKYVSLDAEERYKYVLEKVQEIKQKDDHAVNERAVQHLLNRNRRMDLVDLTLL